jgi:excisionase family DNA binding protein
MKTLSTAQAARLLGVSDQSVANWVDSGDLRAGKTPGGHRRVEPKDLVKFLKRLKLRVPSELLSDDTVMLVVDDEQEVGQSIKRSLKTKHPDWKISIALDGYAAGEAVATDHPHVVLLNLHVPGMDGLEICRKLKAMRIPHRTLVVALAALPSPQDKEAAMSAGAAAYLPKPVDLDHLWQTIHKLLPVSG